MLGRVTMFIAGGWLFMSAFAWPQSDAAAVNTAVGGLLCVGYALLALFIGPARYLNTVHACALCLTSLALDGGEVSAACANNVMIAAVVFGASLLSARSPAGTAASRLASRVGAGRAPLARPHRGGV
jgi:hypothetical protein